jgi:hypothetical protein
MTHTHDVKNRDTLEGDISISPCYNNYNIIIEFTSFCLKSRFNNNYNLSLAYLLIYAQSARIRDVARILGVSRSLFYSKILPENPCFISEKLPVPGWGCGGRERWIRLSREALEYQQAIKALALLHLGENECQRLRIEAARIRRESLRAQRRRDEMFATAVRVCRRDPSFIPFWSRRLGVEKEELRRWSRDVEEGSQLRRRCEHHGYIGLGV